MQHKTNTYRAVLATSALLLFSSLAAAVRADLRGGHRNYGHAIIGSSRHFGFGHSSWWRPSHFRYGGSRFSLSLGFGFGSFGGYWYSPAYYAPAYYWPSYYDSVYYAAPVRPAVIYDVYPDAERDYRSYERTTPPRPSRAEDEENDYYLYRKPTPKPEPALKSAVEDIEDAFRTGDTALLERHIRLSEQIPILVGDRITRRVTGEEYVKMTRGALAEMKTASYKLTRIEPASGGNWRAVGTHVVRTEDGKDKTYEVQFILRKSGDTWLIDEVGGELVGSARQGR